MMFVDQIINKSSCFFCSFRIQCRIISIVNNPATISNPAFGRLGDEDASGHWLHAFLRKDRKGGQAFLVIVNLHGHETMRDVKVRAPGEVVREIGSPEGTVRFVDRLATDWSATVHAGDLSTRGLVLPDLPPCSALYLEVPSQATEPVPGGQSGHL